MHHDFFDEISVRIDDGKSLSISDVIDHHGYEEFRLSYTGLSDDIHMTKAIFIIYPKGYTDAPIVRLTEDAK